MTAKRIEITVPQATWDRIEAARGAVPRAAWIKLAIESVLAGSEFNRLLDSPNKADRKEAARRYDEAVARHG